MRNKELSTPKEKRFVVRGGLLDVKEEVGRTMHLTNVFLLMCGVWMQRLRNSDHVYFGIKFSKTQYI